MTAPAPANDPGSGTLVIKCHNHLFFCQFRTCLLYSVHGSEFRHKYEYGTGSRPFFNVSGIL